MTHQQQISILNKLAIYAILFILGAITFSQCNSCDAKKDHFPDVGKMVKLLDTKAKRLAVINDSLQSIKQPLLIRYKTVRKEVLVNIHDTISVLKFVYKCDSVITLDSALLVNCYDLVTTKENIINKKDAVIYNKDVEIKQSKKELRKQKVKTALVGLTGLVATSLVVYFSIK